jgi:uncharacterized membrane protein
MIPEPEHDDRRSTGGSRSSDAGPPRAIAESGRVEAFSDGVLAIAITLLVLNLHSSAQAGKVAHDILTQWPIYVAYIATFLYIGVVWVNHHAMFTRIARVDSGLLWRNLGLLLPASVLPFPTAELAFAMNQGTHHDQVSALLLYAVISAAMGCTWLVIFHYLARHPELLVPDVPAGFFRGEYRRAIPGIVVPAVPVLIGLWAPYVALVSMVAMPVFYAVTADGLRKPRRLRNPGP